MISPELPSDRSSVPTSTAVWKLTFATALDIVVLVHHSSISRLSSTLSCYLHLDFGHTSELFSRRRTIASRSFASTSRLKLASFPQTTRSHSATITLALICPFSASGARLSHTMALSNALPQYNHLMHSLPFYDNLPGRISGVCDFFHHRHSQITVDVMKNFPPYCVLVDQQRQQPSWLTNGGLWFESIGRARR
jgi:hypothetical protein